MSANPFCSSHGNITHNPLSQSDFLAMSLFKDLMKKKGLHGGKYSRGLEEEVTSLLDDMDKVEDDSNAATGEKKRKF